MARGGAGIDGNLIGGVVLIWVPGIPQPKGSKFTSMRGGRVLLIESADKKRADGTSGALKKWSFLVNTAAGAYYSGECLECAVHLDLVFFFPRPKYHFRTNGELKPSAPLIHTVKPDGDKLARAVADALAGVAYTKDQLIAKLSVLKLYEQDKGPGVAIKFEPIAQEFVGDKEETQQVML